MRGKRLYIQVVLAILLGVLQGILGLGCAWLLKLVVDIVTGANAEVGFSDFCLLACIFYLIYLGIFWFSKKASSGAMRNIRIQVKERLSKGLIWQSEAMHRKSQLGEVLSRFQYQVDMLENIYYEPLFQLVRNGAVGMISVGAIWYLEWRIALISAALFAVYMGFTHGLQKKLTNLQTQSVKANEGESGALTAMVNGFYTAKDYGQEGFFLTRYQEGAAASALWNFRCDFMYDLLSAVSIELEPIMTLLVVLVGGTMLVFGNTTITVGGILGLTQLISAALGPIGELGSAVTRIKSAKEVRQSFTEYEKAGREGKEVWMASGTTLPKLEKISLQNVSCGYGEDVILEHVSLELLAGKKYAIIGESGSGKTTLLRLILKQLPPIAGDIRWNGISYEDIGKASLLRHISYVAQSPMIFHKNVQENILAGREVDRNKLAQVLRQSNLMMCRGGMAEDALLRLPAREMSGGEKKRLAYARALYRDGEILVLDEFTSAVHEKMAEDLEAGILKMNNRMILHVTHQLNEENRQLYDAVFEVHGKDVVRV